MVNTYWDLKQQLADIKSVDLPVKKCERVKISFWMADRRAKDLTNTAESVMDLLVDCKVLVDDSWQITGDMLLLSKGIDRENPRAEVEIEIKQY